MKHQTLYLVHMMFYMRLCNVWNQQGFSTNFSLCVTVTVTGDRESEIGSIKTSLIVLTVSSMRNMYSVSAPGFTVSLFPPSFPLSSESTFLQRGPTELHRAADEDFSVWNPWREGGHFFCSVRTLGSTPFFVTSITWKNKWPGSVAQIKAFGPQTSHTYIHKHTVDAFIDFM